MLDEAILKTLPYIIACQKNSYRKSITSTLVACKEISAWFPPKAPSNSSTERGGEEKSNGKKKKKKQKSQKKNDNKDSDGPAGKYGLLFSDTVLFPTGGGQPNDLGTISYKNQDGVEFTQNVLDVVRMKDDQRIILHYVENPVEKGTEVVINVDWDRRFDHMQQHSAQHLITAVTLSHIGWSTTSWNLSARKSKHNQPCYLDLGAELKEVTADVLSDLEMKVNEKVRNSLSMQPNVYEPEEFAAMQSDVRSGSKGIKSGKGPVRTVTIEGIESNTCCGTHVLHTGHLQSIKLLGAEKGPDKSTTRVWFVAGDRVCDHFGQLYNTSTKLTRLLTCTPTEHYQRAHEIVQSNKESARQIKNLLRSMAELLSNVNLYPEYSIDYTIVRHVDEGTQDFMKQFMRIANDNTKKKETEKEQASDISATILVSIGNSADGGACMMQGMPKVIDELGPALSILLGNARGGGKNGKYQMKIGPNVFNEKVIREMEILAKEKTLKVLNEMSV
jgi:misacylated tRNA(Ala) deacylase